MLRRTYQSKDSKGEPIVKLPEKEVSLIRVFLEFFCNELAFIFKGRRGVLQAGSSANTHDV